MTDAPFDDPTRLRQRQLGFLLLLGVALGWGLNWPALKTVVSEVPVWQFRAVTGIVGAVLLLLLAVALRQHLWPVRRHLPALLIASLFNVTSWFVLIAYGADLLRAAHASILAFTMPIFGAVLGVLFVGERMTWARFLALVLTVGVVVVILSHDFDALGASPWGVLVTLLGALNWAVGVLILKHTPWTVSPLPLAGWQLLIGSIPIAVVALVIEDFVYHEASEAALWSSVYLVLVALVFCYAAWFAAVRALPAAVSSVGVLLVPIVGAVSGALILDDPFGWREITALLMVVAAIALVLFLGPRDRPADAGSPTDDLPPNVPVRP